MTNYQSFQIISNFWYKYNRFFYRYAMENVNKLLVGNKCDLTSKKVRIEIQYIQYKTTSMMFRLLLMMKEKSLRIHMEFVS